MKKIIFVCNGNIHRSVIAAECLRTILKKQNIDSEYFVDSYGIQGTMDTEPPKKKQLIDYKEEWNAAKITLKKFGIDISNHFSQAISIDVIKSADVIIAMDNKVYKEANNSLLKQFPQFKEKIHCFSELSAYNKVIEDPAGSEDKQLHKDIIETIHSTLVKKYENILSWLK